MDNELKSLREQLCVDARTFCRECFAGTAYEAVQNPPNVFRVGRNLHAKICFVFDKPNNNDGFHRSDLVPITICDPRPIFGPPATHRNLLLLLDKLGFTSGCDFDDPLDSELIHFTNAVKCDKNALTGDMGGIAVGPSQVRNCVSRFLLRELAIVKPIALVFFGVAAQRNVLGHVTRLGAVQRASIAGVMYWVMRVPHTTAQSFNTHGEKGDYYKEPFRNLLALAGLE